MHVIKIGGAAGVAVNRLVDDVAALHEEGQRFVLVHGGSAETARLAADVGHAQRVIHSPSGHQSRRTDARTLELFLMATALVNRRIVARLGAAGVPAVGLSGIDGRLLPSERKGAIRSVENGRVRLVRDDLSGRPGEARVEVLEALLAAGFLPVVAPVGLGEGAQPLNVDGDRAAAALAVALGAQGLLLMTGVPGLLANFPNEDSLIREVPFAELDTALAATGGRMKKKVLGAREALSAGVPRVVIAGSSTPRPIAEALNGGGTHILAPRTAEKSATTEAVAMGGAA